MILLWNLLTLGS